MSAGSESTTKTHDREDPLFHFNVDQYIRIVEAGVFPEEARLYLRDGLIVEKDDLAEFEDPLYDVTTDQFFAMIEAGVFPQEARVYLWDGRIIEKMAKTNAHSLVAMMINERLTRAIPEGWKMFLEAEFWLDARTAFLPDLAIVRAASYRAFLDTKTFPHANQIGLGVEIAVTSLKKDLGINLRRYAQAMIPTYWVADVIGKRLLVHSNPRVADGEASYGDLLIVTAGQTVPLVLDGREVAQFRYDDLMP